jgi:hypothetical protein
MVGFGPVGSAPLGAAPPENTAGKITLAYADALIRALDERESSAPGTFLPFSEISHLANNLSVPLPEELSLVTVVTELMNWDWIESNGQGFDLTENSFRITAKGQNRSSASVNYADVFQQAIDAAPLADDAIVEYKSADKPFGQGSFGEGTYDNSSERAKPYNGVIARGIGEPSIRFGSTKPSDSTTWTGKQFVLVDAAVIADIKIKADALHQAVYALHLASNSETEDLQKLADSLVLICSMTEPELSIIDQITSSPKFKAYAGLLVIIATLRGALGI